MGAIPGSDRRPLTAATVVGPVDPDESLEITVFVRRQPGGGADEGDLDAVGGVLESRGLQLVRTHAPSGRLHVAGRLANLVDVFGTSLELVRSGEVEHRHRTGTLSVPDELDGVVTAVLGLDDRPQARAQFRVAAGPATSYTPVEVGAAYHFPADTDGTGQSVSIIELGGGFDQSDLDTYFSGLGIPAPTVTAHGVDGATNVPGGEPSGADGEVLLDVEVIGALAPAAQITVWFAPNTDQGFVDAVSDAVHASPTPTAVSISWGQSEDAWTAQARTALDQAFADGAALGVTVCVASGDNGSSDGQTDGSDHVDFPASSPHALACGGTSLRPSTETVWNNGSSGGATGGGISDTFAQPAWQSGVPATASGRGVPDVSGDADPQTGYQVLVDGQSIVIGGTSAVAPLWAALVARLAQALGRPLGLVQQQLYTLDSGFRDIVSGTNGSYSAGPGWDACTGLGSPDGEALLAALRSATG